MTPHSIWIALPALFSAALLAGGLLVGRPAPLSEGPAPTLHVSARAGLAARLVDVETIGGWQKLPARLVGRYSLVPEGVRHQWPGIYAEARFDGSRIAVSLADSANRYRLRLDDDSATDIVLSRPGGSVVLIEGLRAGPHLVRLDRLSEATAPGNFGGFFIPADATALPPAEPRELLIEFVGDSDTVGYGNTAPGRDCTPGQQFAATDTLRAFGPRLAAALDADYRMIASSGIGLVRNYAGAPGPTMSDTYPLALPDEPDRDAAPESEADVVVIGIGSNDFSTALGPDEFGGDPVQLRDSFAAALFDFMQRRQAEQPSARLVLLAFGEYGKDLVAAHATALSAFRETGGDADLIVLPQLARTGCHWHPSQDDHHLIATRLADLLRDRGMAASND